MVIFKTPGSGRTVQIAAVLTIVLGLSVLSACGGSGSAPAAEAGGTSGVASIQTPATARAQATARATKAERPLIRPDASKEEIGRLMGVYIDCMVKYGLPKSMVTKGSNWSVPASLDDLGLGAETEKKIKVNCATKQPEASIERAKRLDPDYADQARATVKCMNDHGVKAIMTDDGYPSIDGLPSQSKAHWVDDCEREAFASYYSTLN